MFKFAKYPDKMGWGTGWRPIEKAGDFYWGCGFFFAIVSDFSEKLGTPVSSQFHALVASPFDKVHRLLQTQGSNPKVLSGERAEYAGIVDCFRRVLASERNESNSGLASPSFSASFGKKT